MRKKRVDVDWTEDEVSALLQGIRLFGRGKWWDIKFKDPTLRIRLWKKSTSHIRWKANSLERENRLRFLQSDSKPQGKVTKLSKRAREVKSRSRRSAYELPANPLGLLIPKKKRSALNSPGKDDVIPGKEDFINDQAASDNDLDEISFIPREDVKDCEAEKEAMHKHRKKQLEKLYMIERQNVVDKYQSSLEKQQQYLAKLKQNVEKMEQKFMMTIDQQRWELENLDKKYASMLELEEPIVVNKGRVKEVSSSAVEKIGKKESISGLYEEYHGNVRYNIFEKKIEVLVENFVALRSVCKDGNCFLRAFIFSYLELILERRDKEEVTRIAGILQGYELPYSELFIQELKNVLLRSMSHSDLLERYQQDSVSDPVIALLRLVMASEIREHSDRYQSILYLKDAQYSSIEEFISSEVQCMGVDCGEAHIAALTNALGIQISIMHLDSNQASSSYGPINAHVFGPDVEGMHNTSRSIHLLYRPGHYDILYPNQSCAESGPEITCQGRQLVLASDVESVQHLQQHQAGSTQNGTEVVAIRQGQGFMVGTEVVAIRQGQGGLLGKSSNQF